MKQRVVTVWLTDCISPASRIADWNRRSECCFEGTQIVSVAIFQSVRVTNAEELVQSSPLNDLETRVELIEGGYRQRRIEAG